MHQFCIPSLLDLQSGNGVLQDLGRGAALEALLFSLGASDFYLPDFPQYINDISEVLWAPKLFPQFHFVIKVLILLFFFFFETEIVIVL